MARPKQPVHIYIKTEAKYCGSCRERNSDGQYLLIPGKPLYHRWICAKCIASEKSAIVKAAYKNGQLRRPTAVAPAAGDTQLVLALKKRAMGHL